MALSNYLYTANPAQYGGQQEDYLQRAEATIQRGVETIQSRLSTRIDPAEIFLEVQKLFSESRHQIAVDHGTTSAEQFGTLRKTPLAEGYYIRTQLEAPYERYSHVVKEQFCQMLSTMKHDARAFQETTKSFRENILGQETRFDVKIYNPIDLIGLFENHPQEKTLQKLAKSPLSADKIQADYKCLRHIKNKGPEVYQHLGLLAYIQDLARNRRDTPFNAFALGTLHIKLSDKFYPTSQYLVDLDIDNQTDPVERMAKTSGSMIIHQDVFLSDEMQSEMAKLFARAMAWRAKKDSLDELKNRVALFRKAYSDWMPNYRGDGAIGDWWELAIYRVKGFTQTHYSHERLPCFESLASLSLSRYLAEYGNIISVEALEAPAASAEGSSR